MSANTQRVVLISGGSRGLGAELVAAFLAHGDRVATFSRTPTSAVEAWSRDKDTASRFRFAAIDIMDSLAVAAFVKHISREFGEIEVLINNAGAASESLLALARDEDIDRTIDLNLKATV